MPCTPNVLVIDDDASILAWLDSVLSNDGFTVETHPDGEGILTSLQLGQVDLVIIDYHLNDRSGLSILREIRQKKNTTPVIIVTADFNQQIAIECFRVGADDFITKPIDPDYLKLVIRRTLEAKSHSLKTALYKSLGYARHKDGCTFHRDHNVCNCGLIEIFDLVRNY